MAVYLGVNVQGWYPLALRVPIKWHRAYAYGCQMGAAEHHQQNRALVDPARLVPNPSHWTETSVEKYRSTSLISKSPIIHHALPNWTQTSNSLPCFPFTPVVDARPFAAECGPIQSWRSSSQLSGIKTAGRRRVTQVFLRFGIKERMRQARQTK